MIIDKFEEQVERSPHNAAVKAGNKTLTYRQLDYYANRVANEIIKGDKKEENKSYRGAALLFEHGIDMIAGVIGALKAHRMYVPLDIAYPVKRLAYILENSGSSLILTNGKNVALAEKLAGQIHGSVRILNIEGISGENPGTIGNRETAGDKPAYILYTSGSTGQPKGVMQTHRNVLYYIRNWVQRFSITAQDRMTLFSAFTHDGAGQDIFAALLTGACLYPYSIKIESNAKGIYNLLKEDKITIWHSVPTLFRFFIGTLTGKECFNDIRWVLLGGESIRPRDLELFKPHFPNAVLANVYGQTESSVDSICAVSREDIFDDVTIGEPLDETEIFLVNDDGDIIEDMGVGEIVIASNYIAPGYWQDERNSREVFLQDEEGGFLYLTGDMGRLTGRGTIKMMGRKDHQVKIRGFRIELGEIESQLLTHENIKETVVLAREDNNREYLCAYIAAQPGETKPIDQPGLRNYLSERLPDYMVPSSFVQLDEIPLTPNGKIDRNALQAPVPERENLYVAPRNHNEKKLVEIWADILALEEKKIGIHDNFFHSGGNSLTAIQMLSKIYKYFHTDIPFAEMYVKPTIGELALYINAPAAAAPRQDPGEIDPGEINKELSQTRQHFVKLVKYIVDRNEYIILYTDANHRQLQEIESFLSREYSPALIPHYVKPAARAPGENIIRLDRESFAKVMELETFTWKEKGIKHLWEYHLKKLKKDLAAFQRDIESRKISDDYYCGCLVQYYLDTRQRWVSFWDKTITNEPDIKNLEKAIIDLINNQSLLRAMLIKKKGEYRFAEFAALEQVKLPVIDLSGYNIDAEDLGRIKTCLLTLLKRNILAQPPLGHMLFNLVILKLNRKDYYLAFVLDHKISDYQSGRILEVYFRDYYERSGGRDNNPAASPGNSYKEYIKEYLLPSMNPGTAAAFKRSQYYKLYKKQAVKLREIFQREKNIILSEPYIIEYYIENGENQSRDPLAYGLYIAVNLCRIQFNRTKIPLKLYSNIRNFGGSKYYYTIGDMHDNVPLLLDSENSDNTPGKCYRKWLEIHDKYTKNKIYFKGLGHADKEIFELVTRNPVSINYGTNFDALPPSGVSYKSLKAFRNTPYPISITSKGTNTLMIIFLNGIKIDKLTEIKSFLDNSGNKYTLRR